MKRPDTQALRRRLRKFRTTLSTLGVVTMMLVACDAEEKKSSPSENGEQTVFAVAEAPAPKKTALPEEVDRILSDMSGYLESLDQFTFSADILFDEILASGQAIQHGAELKGAVHRPDKLASRFESDRGMRTMWYNGETITMFNNDNGVYAKTNAPPKIDQALDYLMEKFDVSMPLADFVSEDVYGSLTTHVDHALYVGKALVDGRTCDHIACSQELIDWQIWVEDGIRRLPRKVLITYKTVPGTPVYMAQFSNWDLEARLPELLFNANLPPEAIKIDFLEVE